jgi:hypothetical protein
MRGLMGRLSPVLVGYRVKIKHSLAVEAPAGLPSSLAADCSEAAAVFQLYI